MAMKIINKVRARDARREQLALEHARLEAFVANLRFHGRMLLCVATVFVAAAAAIWWAV